MRNIIRFYNENRLTFWIIVLIILFIIFLLHFFNGLAREESKRNYEASKNRENSNTTQASINKEKETTKPIISGEEISNTKKTNNNNIIESFLNYCKNSQIDEAYNLLSSNCKEVYYNSKEQPEEGFEAPILCEKVKLVAWLKRSGCIGADEGITILNEGCIPIPDWINK